MLALRVVISSPHRLTSASRFSLKMLIKVFENHFHGEA